MADRELGVKVTGDIDDITEKLGDLTSRLGDLTDKSVDVTVNADTTPIDMLDSSLSGVSTAADDVSNSIDNITPEAINEAASAAGAMGDSFGAAKEEVSSTDDAVKGMGDGISNAVTSVAGLSGAFTGVGGQINNAVSAVQKFAESTGISLTATQLLELALISLVAVGIVTYLTDATQAAGEFNDSWLRLGEAVDEGGRSIDSLQGEWGDAIQTMKDETGRSAGIIRDHIINMGLAGIESKDLIIDAFEGISGAAFVTGQSIDSIEQAYRRAVSTGMLGSRQLMQIGITTDDVYKATGMTMDQVRDKFKSLDTEGRAALLNLIINQKYGESANEAYKNSWQHVGDALNAAWQALSIFIGQLIIPVVTPAIEALTLVINGLANWIKTVEGFFNLLTKSVGNSSVVFGGLIGILTAFNPVLMGMGVIVGFVADNWGRLTQDWNNFWSMVGSGDWAGTLDLLVNELKWALVDAPISYLASLPEKVGQFASKFLDIGKNIVNWIVSGLTSLSGWLDKEISKEFGSAGKGAATGMVSGFDKWLDDNGWKVVEIVGDLVTKVAPKLVDIAIKLVILIGKAIMKEMGNQLAQLPGNMYKWGYDALTNFANGIIDSIPGLRDALDRVKQLFPQSPPKAGPLADITESGMYDWMSGIAQAGSRAMEGFNLNNMIIPTGISNGNVSNISTNSNSNQIQVNVNMKGANIGGETDAQSIGATIGKTAAQKITEEALNQGISVVNFIR